MRQQHRSDRDQSIEAQLCSEGYRFDFFQAVRLLERLARLEDADKPANGRQRRDFGEPARVEVARFRAHLSLGFPANDILEIHRPAQLGALPEMTVQFMGLLGPNGVLPRHYTELLLTHERDAGAAREKFAARDWFDLFNHRFISLFYRAWEKYRFFIPFEHTRGRSGKDDPLASMVLSLAGLRLPSPERSHPDPLSRRLVVGWPRDHEDVPRRETLAQVEDLAIVYYSGFFIHRPRSALGLELLLRDYFDLPVKIIQFQGQWLYLEPPNQSRLEAGKNNRLGVDVVAGSRVWDVQSKFRVQVGPLSYTAFAEFLPDTSAVAERKRIFLLFHLVRLYAGLEFDFDVQLVLLAAEIPSCHLADQAGRAPRLGWNTWLTSQPPKRDAREAVFPGNEIHEIPRPDKLPRGKP